MKEYRLNRLFEELKRNKRILPLKPFFFSLFFLTLFFFKKNFSFVFEYIIFVFYSFLSVYVIFVFFKKGWSFPILTPKIFLYLFFSIGLLTFIFLSWQSILFFFLFDLIVFPIFIFSGILIEVPFFFLKFFIKKRAKKKRESLKNLIVIGITGSYGKTSVKEFLFTILSQKFEVLKTPGNVNTSIGIAQLILKELTPEKEIFICEMGAYVKGEVKEICDIVKPKIAILTGVNEQHLALFGSMENLISAEGGKELIESLPEDGLVIFNGENEILRKIYKETKIKKKIVGIGKKEMDLWAANIKVKREVLFFQVFSKDGDFSDFNLNLIGAQNIENILLAACCAKEVFGMSLKEISKASEKITQEQTRVKLIKTKNFNIIDATYSANPNSVLAHLDYLKFWPGKKIIIMPCLIELGKVSKKVHQKIGQKIGEICDLAIITTKENFDEIKKGALEKGMENVFFCNNPKLIFEKIKDFFHENNVLLLEGRVQSEITNFLKSKL